LKTRNEKKKKKERKKGEKKKKTNGPEILSLYKTLLQPISTFKYNLDIILSKERAHF
jgi:hypothetical protein